MDRRHACKMLITVAVMPIVASCRANAGVPRLDQGDNFYLCDGCQAVGERDPAALDWQTEIAPLDPTGERLVLSGTVYQNDGRTPAEGVVIYAHHTNTDGLYADGTDETVWSRRHGRLRAWVKTGPDGRYKFGTIKPGVYPNRSDPAHIHLYLAEPGRPPYWIDNVVFAGEFGVNALYRQTRENRGGSGIVELSRAPEGSWIARRDIVLEQHPELTKSRL